MCSQPNPHQQELCWGALGGVLKKSQESPPPSGVLGQGVGGRWVTTRNNFPQEQESETAEICDVLWGYRGDTENRVFTGHLSGPLDLRVGGDEDLERQLGS